MNESSAICLNYAQKNQKNLNEENKNVLFIDIGHTKMQVFCAGFNQD